MIEHWKPIETAPKDGTKIWLTWMEDDVPQIQILMSWCHIKRNELFSEKIGMWATPTGSTTWTDDDGLGPTYWKEYSE